MSFIDALKGEPFNDQVVTHLDRQAEVVVVKRLRNFRVPGIEDTATGTEHDMFQREFFEFLGSGGLMKKAPALDQKWPDPDGGAQPLYRHYYIQATSPGGIVSGLASRLVGNVAGIGNNDVVAVRATLDTEGRGSCTVSINGGGWKYQFQQNPFRRAQAVFESNDMVLVNLPGLDGRQRRVFTGLITTVRVETQTGDTLQTTIILECEDMLKSLAQSRTAVRPSLTPAMSGGKYFQGLDNDFEGRLPHDILATILGRAFCDFYSTPGFLTRLAEIRGASSGFVDNGAGSDQKLTTAAVEEEQELRKRLPLPTPTAGVPYNIDSQYPFLAVVASPNASKATSFLDVALGEFAAPPKPAIFGTPTLLSQATTVPDKIYGFRKPKNQAAATPLASPSIQDAIAAGAPINAGDADDLAFVISGTQQVPYKLAFSGAAALYVADWQSGLGICRQIADELNYEFFANENGTVLFRPLNVTLPRDFKMTDKKLPSSSMSPGRVGTEYWLQQKLIQGTPQYIDTDANIFTIAYVCSDWQVGSPPSVFKGTASDVFRYSRLGARTAPLVTKMLLNDDRACEAYAVSYLNRLNALASSAVVVYTGDARLQVGNPCYVPDRNTVYYISAVTHDFVAGQGYRTTLTLKYGRRPFAVADPAQALAGVTSAGLATLVSFRTLDDMLSRLRKLGAQTKLLGAAVSNDPTAQAVDYLASYIQGNLSDLTFQGYVWEPLLPLDYESLKTTIADQMSMDARKEIALNYSVKSPAFFAVYQQMKRRFPGVELSPTGGAPVTPELLARTTQAILSNRGTK